MMMSLNPVLAVLKNEKGWPRAAKESDIAVSQNMVLDADFIDKQNYAERLEALETNIQSFNEYWNDLGIKTPVRAFTGRGYHYLFPYAPISVKEHPDISQRIKKVHDQFRQEFFKVLEHLGAKADYTQDLRRVIRIYGTSKPSVGIMSCFFGDERKEDNDGIRNYLLNLNITENYADTLDTKIKQPLPQLFRSMMNRDDKLRDLWHGVNKQEGDTSKTGYDHSLITKLLHLGFDNLGDLSTILAERPNGAVKGSGKGDQYIWHTLANETTSGILIKSSKDRGLEKVRKKRTLKKPSGIFKKEPKKSVSGNPPVNDHALHLIKQYNDT